MDNYAAELFQKLPWRIQDISVLETGTDFITEETVEKCDFWKGIQHRKREKPPPKKGPVDKKMKTTLDRLTERIFTSKNKFDLPYYPQRSTLTENQHKNSLQALQILQSGKNPALYNQEERNVLNLFGFMSQKITQENELFLQFIENKWKEEKNIRRTSLHSNLLNYAMERWKKDLERIKDYDQYYKMHNMISITDRKNPIEAIALDSLIEMGCVAKTVLPIKENMMKYNVFKLSSDKVPLADYLEESRKPVSQDKNADILAKLYQPDIVISSSGLKTLLDNYPPHYNNVWDIPVVVKSFDINGTNKEVSFVDKPFPKKNPTVTDFNYRCRKHAIKNNFCKLFGFKFNPDKLCSVLGYNVDMPQNKKKKMKKKKLIETVETNKPNENEDQHSNKLNMNNIKTDIPQVLDDINDSLSNETNKNPINPNYTSHNYESLRSQENQNAIHTISQPQNEIINEKVIDSDDESLLQIDEIFDDIDGNSTTEDVMKPEIPELKEIPEKLPCNQININPEKTDTVTVTEISDKITNLTEIKSNVTEPTKNAKKNFIKNYHNVTYRMWILRNNEPKSLLKSCEARTEIRILVRCKVDGCVEVSKQNFRPLMLIPKLEYQWEYGSEILAKSDLLRQWATLFFRPGAELVRVLSPTKNGSIMAYDRCNVEKIGNQVYHYYSLPPTGRLEVLFRILSSLMNIDAGNYLLHHELNHGSFVALMKSTDDLSIANQTLNLQKLYCAESCQLVHDKTWLPINKTFILPMHLSNGLLPATFPVKFRNDLDKSKSKKKNKWVKKDT